jgi:hypothetical protein
MLEGRPERSPEGVRKSGATSRHRDVSRE